VSFEQATRDLTTADPAARLRAARMLKEAAYPEAAAPLAALVTDPQDEIQLEAIAAAPPRTEDTDVTKDTKANTWRALLCVLCNLCVLVFS
jgi:hypothetical protein